MGAEHRGSGDAGYCAAWMDAARALATRRAEGPLIWINPERGPKKREAPAGGLGGRGFEDALWGARAAFSVPASRDQSPGRTYSIPGSGTGLSGRLQLTEPFDDNRVGKGVTRFDGQSGGARQDRASCAVLAPPKRLGRCMDGTEASIGGATVSPFRVASLERQLAEAAPRFRGSPRYCS
jgi:hypothetical protein